MSTNEENKEPAKFKSNSHNESKELNKGKVYIVVEIIEYMPNAVVSKTIIKKATGNVTVSSLEKNWLKKHHLLIRLFRLLTALLN